LWLCALVAAAVALFIWFLFERVLMLELYAGFCSEMLKPRPSWPATEPAIHQAGVRSR